MGKYCKYFCHQGVLSSSPIGGAQSYGQMDHYAEVIGDDASLEDYLRVATYFEKNEKHFKAGVFYFKASQFAKAGHLFSGGGGEGDGLGID